MERNLLTKPIYNCIEKQIDRRQKIITILFFIVFSFVITSVFSQSPVCITSDPFCTNDVMTFPAGVDTGDAESGPDYGCLSTRPNPAWYHMLIETAGNIVIEISSSPAYDIDFICWGPFDTPDDPCNGQLLSSKIVDCSYLAGSAPEYCDITNAQVGKYYILLITNWSNQACFITFSKTSGTGETDCGIVPAQASSNSPICQGETLQLIAETVNNATYHWTGPAGFTSNQQNPSIPNAQISNSGTYTLVVTQGGNNSNPYPINVDVNALPLASFSSNTVCSGEATNFTDLSTCSAPATPINSWFWDFGDGNTSSLQNPSHTYPDSDVNITYNVHLTVTTSAGCSDDIFQSIQVLGKPSADFSYVFDGGNACHGSSISFSDLSTNNEGIIESWQWDFGNGDTSSDQNPSYTYPNTGEYTVTLNVVNSGGCSSSIQYNIIVNGLPIALFSSDNACSGESIAFTDLSTCETPATPITNWEWDFGDGNTSSLQNPSHVYEISDLNITYNVILIVTTSAGCIDEISQEIEMFGKPFADFSYTFEGGTSCFGGEIQFTDLSSNSEGNLESWQWDFGNGNSSSEQNPIYIYPNSGTYTVSLTVTNTAGCDSTIQKPINVFNEPEINFSFTEVCFGLTTDFNDSDYINVLATDSWSYDFGDGNSADISNPSHNYNTAGEYNVVFSIIDTNGCENSISHLVPVFESPVAQFSNNTVCLFSHTQFTDQSTPPSAIENWNWDFGDSETSFQQNPMHLYSESGYFNVSLIVGNDNCFDTIIQQVQVWEPPIANFIYSDTSCSTGLLYFNDSSYSNESNIVSYMWNFPDGHVSFAPNTYFIFLNTEVNYDISLMVTDARGCIDTIHESIFIEPDLQMNFISDTVCLGNETTLSAYIVKPQNDSIIQYNWFFNDGSAQVNTTNRTVLHEFLEPGLFEVRLQATNLSGCDNIFRKHVKVRENPISDFSFQESFCYDSTIFSDHSIEAEGNIIQWNWDYGDGHSFEVNSPSNPDHYYFYSPIYQTYQSSLSIVDQFGCRDSIIKDIVHYPCVLVDFFNDTSWICQNTEAVFIDSTVVDSDFSINEKTWFFGDGNSLSVSPEIDTVYYQYQEHGTYPVKLIIGYQGENLQTYDSTEKTIRILASPQLQFTTESVCLGEPTDITNLSTIGEDQLREVFWDYGDGNDTNYIFQPQYNSHIHKFGSDGSYSIFLKIKADNNCMDSTTNLAIIHPVPEMGFLADSTIHCGNALVTFTDTSHINSGIIASRLWTFGDGDFLLSPEEISSHDYQSGLFSVSLENTSDHYCKKSLTLDDYILINPIIEAEFEIDPDEVSINGKSNLNVNNLVDVDSYFQWILSDTIIWENIFAPNIADSIFDTGTYKLKMYTVNQYGCIDSSYKFFKVTPVYSFYVPTAFSPNGNGTNDTFGPAGKYFDMKSYSLRIFSRWGDLVFHTNDFFEHWDGTNKAGNIAEMGTYAWVIQLTDMDGNYKIMRGAVTLLL